MGKWTKWLNNFAVDYFVKYMKDNKELVNEKINKKMNIPILDEKQEGELIAMIQDVIIDVAKGMKK
tara:strand:- start:419 stop:616 length:198 start_codon:yes stop_codon:yes gene_type:complete